MIEAGTPRIISFLHDCLAEDRSSSGVPSIFASKIRARRFLAGSDNPLAESTGIIDLPPSQAAPLIRDAALYRRERELLHGSLFLADWLEQQDALRQHPSIGFLSPFRNQVDALLDVLDSRLDQGQISRRCAANCCSAAPPCHCFRSRSRKGAPIPGAAWQPSSNSLHHH